MNSSLKVIALFFALISRSCSHLIYTNWIYICTACRCVKLCCYGVLACTMCICAWGFFAQLIVAHPLQLRCVFMFICVMTVFCHFQWHWRPANRVQWSSLSSCPWPPWSCCSPWELGCWSGGGKYLYADGNMHIISSLSTIHFLWLILSVPDVNTLGMLPRHTPTCTYTDTQSQTQSHIQSTVRHYSIIIQITVIQWWEQCLCSRNVLWRWENGWNYTTTSYTHRLICSIKKSAW